MKRFFPALLSTALLAGCTGGPAVWGSPEKRPDVERRTESGEVEMVAEVETFQSGLIKAFPDIPIPSSHRVNLEQSVIFTSPTQTVGKVALDGNGDVDSLFRFFESEMTGQGWSMVNAFQSSTSSLYFAKPGRFVAIIIEASGKKGSRVYINVGPE